MREDDAVALRTTLITAIAFVSISAFTISVVMQSMIG